jgi:hypothetical protein
MVHPNERVFAECSDGSRMEYGKASLSEHLLRLLFRRGPLLQTSWELSITILPNSAQPAFAQAAERKREGS